MLASAPCLIIAITMFKLPLRSAASSNAGYRPKGTLPFAPAAKRASFSWSKKGSQRQDESSIRDNIFASKLLCGGGIVDYIELLNVTAVSQEAQYSVTITLPAGHMQRYFSLTILHVNASMLAPAVISNSNDIGPAHIGFFAIDYLLGANQCGQLN